MTFSRAFRFPMIQKSSDHFTPHAGSTNSPASYSFTIADDNPPPFHYLQTTSAPPILNIASSTQDPDLKELFLKDQNGTNFYLVPINTLIGGVRSNRRRIVAAKSADIDGSPALWSDSDISASVQTLSPIDFE